MWIWWRNYWKENDCMNRFYFENNRFFSIFLYIIEKLEEELGVKFEKDTVPDYKKFGLDEKERINTGYLYINNKLVGIDGSDSSNIRNAFRKGDWNLIIKMQHLKEKYKEIYQKQCLFKVVPWTYLPTPYFFFNEVLDISSKNKKHNLYFRSQAGQGRKQFIDNFNNYLLQHNINVENLVMTCDKLKNIMDYFNDHYYINTGYSMKGMGNACHRELEYFQFGIPTIMPPYKILYLNELIPNKHYIEAKSVEPKDILDAYHNLINNLDLYEEISKNCFDWHIVNYSKKNILNNLMKIFTQYNII